MCKEHTKQYIYQILCEEGLCTPLIRVTVYELTYTDNRVTVKPVDKFYFARTDFTWLRQLVTQHYPHATHYSDMRLEEYTITYNIEFWKHATKGMVPGPGEGEKSNG